MTELNPATEAEGTAVANIENPPPDDKGVICDAVQIEGEQKRDADEKKEIIEKIIYGNEEDEGKKDVNVKDSEGQEHEEEKKEGEVEDDGDKRKECEVDVGDKKEEGEVKENGDEKKVGEVQVNGDEKKEGKEMKDVEEKEDGQQNGIKKIESKDGVKENMEDVNKEVEGAKMVDAEHVMANDSEDVKMVDTEDVNDEEKGGETGVQEGAQNKTEKDVSKEGDGGTIAWKVDEVEVADGSKKKRSRTKRASQKGEGKGKEGEKKAKELLASPISSVERPVRERKTVERLVEVIEKEPNREFQVEKGRGTPLKDIPNVAYKLARKKPADIKLIHQTLFGRKGKAVNFKSHILQFSGFVWHESDEKQRAKMKEKLDKYVKDTLLDLCDLFDLPVSRANSRKEDLVTKLLDFLVAPHPTTDVILAEKDQKSRKRKRMARGGASKSRVGMPTKRSKKRTKNEDTPNAKDSSAQGTENEEDDDDEKEKDLSDEKLHKHSEAEAMETESEEAADEDEDQDDDVDEYDEEKSGKRKQDKKKTIQQRGAAYKEKLKAGTSLKQSPPPTSTKNPVKRSSSKHSKDEENNDTNTKVFTSKKRNSDYPKKKSTPKSNTKEKTTDKKTSRGKPNVVEVEQPSKEELRKKICEILKEVDFNTATFTDILKQLATYYKMDLTPRKASLKLMIQEELTKLAEVDEDEEDEDDDNVAVKEEKPEPKGKEVEA